MSLNGVLVIDKPAGMTSHDVVARVRKILGTKKVGHAGTLDPDATGILVLGIGHATRLLSYAQAGPKRYVAVASFGTSTTSQDASGEVIETRPVQLDAAAVTRAAAGFVGDIEQIPPMVSAVKVGGERLYKKARRGEDVERAPRPVTIHSLEMAAFQAEPPEATFDVVCSPGTYVRTLVHDLGEALGCGAHLKTLRRTEASGFTEADAVPLDEAGPSHLRPAVDVVGTLPRLALAPDALRLVADGRPLSAESGDVPVGDLAEDAPVALVSDDTLLAVYKRRGDLLVAEKVLAP
ncbi:MAG TPA: tRNA pseudouridine(55) synthase TruB [Actinomycetota bacterium]|nr:tRNA pseudouridine(55) synthase TruB [Actinomycetota bacterium]